MAGARDAAILQQRLRGVQHAPGLVLRCDAGEQRREHGEADAAARLTGFEMQAAVIAGVFIPQMTVDRRAARGGELRETLLRFRHAGELCEPRAVGGALREPDRKSRVWGKSVSVRVDLGGRSILKK